jgi:hypothetical protein
MFCVSEGHFFGDYSVRDHHI